MTAQVVQLFPDNIQSARERMNREREANLGHVLQDFDLLPTQCNKVPRICQHYVSDGFVACRDCLLYGGPDDAA